MKYMILSKDKKKVMTQNTFNSESDALLEIKKKKNYWLKCIKKNPDLPKIRLNQWKKCIITTVNFEENFGDFGMAFISQQRKPSHSSSKIISNIKQENIQKGVEMTIKSKYG